MAPSMYRRDHVTDVSRKSHVDETGPIAGRCLALTPPQSQPFGSAIVSSADITNIVIGIAVVALLV